ncbi:MAG: P-loop NTPase fold protein [Emcibacteraceae bacterium]|nr:P-loop NTPase fold protein [Emcibacteraceae bacterium]
MNRSEESEWLATYLTNKYASITTDTKKHFVLNINADWGFGKTDFLHRLKNNLEDKKHQVIYFDAWKNDFSDKPLLGFISEINDSLKEFMDEEKDVSSPIKSSFSKLKKAAGPILISFLTKQLIGASFDQAAELFSNDEEEAESTEEEINTDKGDDTKKDIVTTVSSIATKAAEIALADHNNVKTSIDSFTIELGKLVTILKTEAKKELPLFILVDELDRCRPTYAIELLETIKHLFEVKGVYFIIATASNQLSHSINAIYGNNFESKRYLNRFFDQEYKLAEPELYDYCSFLWTIHIPDENNFIPAIRNDQYKNLNINILLLKKHAEYAKASLRDIEQAIKLLSAISLTKDLDLYSNIIFFIIFCKISHPEHFLSWKNYKNSLSFSNLEQSKYFTNNYSKDTVFKYYNGREIIETSFYNMMSDIFDTKGVKGSYIVKNDFPELSIRNFLLSHEQAKNYQKHHLKPQDTLDFSHYFDLVEQVGRLT